MTRAKISEVIEPTAVARATARLLEAPAGPSGPAASGHEKKTGNGGDGERVRYLTREDGRVLESGVRFPPVAGSSSLEGERDDEA